MKKALLKSIPYFIAIAISLSLLYAACLLGDVLLAGWLVNISAAFIFIPGAFLGFETIQKVTKRRLTKEIYDYAKGQIDGDIFSILSHLSKFLDLEEDSFKSFADFLPTPPKDIEKRLKEYHPLGFRIFKKWSDSEKYFHDILKNPMALKVFTDEQIIVLIQILQALQYFDSAIKEDAWHELEVDPQFKVVAGEEISERNRILLPERYILLRLTGKGDEGQYVVTDFGDFEKWNKEKLIRRFSLKEEAAPSVLAAIEDLRVLIKRWLNLTGNKLIINHSGMTRTRKSSDGD